MTTNMNLNHDYDYISVIGICSVNGYEAEVNQCIGLCHDARSESHLLLAVAKVSSPQPSFNYKTKRKHRLQYAVMTRNYSWFKTLLNNVNPMELNDLSTKYMETLYHLLVGNFSVRPWNNDGLVIEYNANDQGDHNKQLNAIKIFRLLVNTPLDINKLIDIHSTGTELNIFVSRDDRTNYTFLMLTIEFRNTQLSDELFAYIRGNPAWSSLPLQFNTKSFYGFTALSLACQAKDEDMVKRLCAIPTVDFNLALVNDKTPFLIAVEQGSLSIVQEMMKYPNRFDINHREHEGKTALLIACQMKHVDIVKLLCTVPHIDFNAVDLQNNTAFTVWAETNILEELIKYRDRFNVNHQRINGWSALHFACLGGNIGALKMLCKIENIRFDLPDTAGNIPFLLAISNGSTEIIQELLRYRDHFDINHRNNRGETVALLACYRGRLDVIKLLCSDPHIAVDVTSASNNGDTPFLIGVRWGNVEIIQDLMKYSGNTINVNHRNNEGKTALHIAVTQKGEPIVKFLCDLPNVEYDVPDTTGYTPFLTALYYGLKEVSEYLIKDWGEHININNRNNRGETAIFLASASGMLNVVKLLCQREELDINQPDNGGRTPLSIATEYNRTEIIHELQKYANQHVSK